jgi:hypothetical protein
MIELERHMGLIENLTVNPYYTEVDQDNVSEILSRYQIQMPSCVTSEQMEKFWGPKQGQDLTKVTELFMHKKWKESTAWEHVTALQKHLEKEGKKNECPTQKRSSLEPKNPGHFTPTDSGWSSNSIWVSLSFFSPSLRQSESDWVLLQM